MTDILIVDDSDEISTQLKKFLQSKGFSCAIVNDGSKALNAIIKHQPDLILMDIVMQGMNGYDTMRIIRKEDQYKQIPIIMITSKAQKLDRVWAERQGANGYFTKPIDHPSLFEHIKTLIK